MLIYLKNKDTLLVDDFEFECCIGKNGKKKNKIEGDGSTPKGKFNITTLYYRSDRVNKPKTKLKLKKIVPNMGWCDDPGHKDYNKEILIDDSVHHEKLYRKYHKYDYILVLDYNMIEIEPNKGSAIFLHLTSNFKPTQGCIALKKKDFEILIKLINKNNSILIN